MVEAGLGLGVWGLVGAVEVWWLGRRGFCLMCNGVFDNENRLFGGTLLCFSLNRNPVAGPLTGKGRTTNKKSTSWNAK